MRFTVGTKYWFMRVLFTRGDDEPRFHSLFLPWAGDQITAIEIIGLTCAEHHKVSTGYDNHLNCDGFIFRDDDGNPWYNQYPNASYGQLDDSEDRTIRRHFETEEILVVRDGEVQMNQDGVGLIADPVKWGIFQSQFEKPFVLATTFLASVHRAMFPTQDNHPGIPVLIRDQMQPYLDRLISEVQSASGKTVTFRPWILRKLDGSEIVTNVMLAHLDDPVLVTA